MVTGFLGSGKTTLVNKWLEREPQSLVIVNEFGEVSVDHALLQSSEERTVALPNGCVCCHLRGDLEEALVGAAMRRRRGEIEGFDRVIVETSGLADPGPVAQTLFADQSLARDFRLGPIVTVVDAADAGGRERVPAIARAQIAAADVIVFSKTDRAAPSESLLNEIQARNPGAKQLASRFGEVDPALFQPSGLPREFAPAAHGGGVRSFVLRFERPVPQALLELFLDTLVRLRGADLLRVKGMVPTEEKGLLAVQGVRHVFDRLRPMHGGEPALVFITNEVEEGEVRSLWNSLSNLNPKRKEPA